MPIIASYSSRAKHSDLRSTKTSRSRAWRGTYFNWATRPGEFWESTPAWSASKTPMASRRAFRSGWGKRRGERGSCRMRCPNFEWRWKRGSGRRGQQVLFRNHVAADISPRTLKIFSADSRRRLQILVLVRVQSWRLKLLMKRLTNKPSPRPSPFPKGRGRKVRRTWRNPHPPNHRTSREVLSLSVNLPLLHCLSTLSSTEGE